MDDNSEKALDERLEKAFDYATDATKQMLTLSTAILSATILLSRDYVRTLSFAAKLCLVGSWLMYLLSAICGIWTLLAITGTLIPQNLKSGRAITRAGNQVLPQLSIWSSNIRIPSFLQIICFILATGMIVVFGIQLVISPLPSPPSTPIQLAPSPSTPIQPTTPPPTPTPSLTPPSTLSPTATSPPKPTSSPAP